MQITEDKDYWHMQARKITWTNASKRTKLLLIYQKSVSRWNNPHTERKETATVVMRQQSRCWAVRNCTKFDSIVSFRVRSMLLSLDVRAPWGHPQLKAQGTKIGEEKRHANEFIIYTFKFVLIAQSNTLHSRRVGKHKKLENIRMTYVSRLTPSITVWIGK